MTAARKQCNEPRWPRALTNGESMGEIPGAAESGVRQRTTADYLELIAHLSEENLALRQQVDQLSVFRQLAYRDDLTGLYNRRLFEERLAQEYSRGLRYGESVSVVLIDLDEFKQINDVAGHQCGDAVLEFFGRWMADTCRDIDVACRIGGDEFAFILPSTDARGVRSLIRRLTDNLRRGIDAPKLPSGMSVEFSWGAATSPGDVHSVSELMVRADEAMYENKRQRRLEREPQQLNAAG